VTGVQTCALPILTVRAPNAMVGDVFELRDLQGRKVASFKLIDIEQEINISHLDSGVYFLSHFSKSNSSSLKIIKN
jgi:hypothetical protein